MSSSESIGSLLARARAGEESGRTPTHRGEAALLVRIATGASAADLLAFPERTVPAEAVARFDSLLDRRRNGEPLQYLAGEWEFHGRTFRCDRRALIPRPETELLIELLAAADVRAGDLLDLGTGTGVLAITARLESPGFRVVAVDRSPEAAALARENARRLSAPVAVLVSDWDSALDPAARFEVVLSNPPYVRREDASRLAREVVDFEPHEALFSDGGDLDAVSAVLRVAAARLRPGGLALVEIGAGQADDVREIVASVRGLELSGIRPDLAGIPRVVVARRRERRDPE